MNANWVLAALVVIVVGVALYLFVWPRWHRRRILRKPFPGAWQQIVERQLPIYSKLAKPLQKQLQQLIQLFLHHKDFIGCAGLQVTDEMRLTIAAQACLLLLNRRTSEYSELRYVYVYPSSFVARRQEQQDSGVVVSHAHHLVGESWDNGKVILAWDEVAKGVRDFTDGYNVVLHEFAHQLDHESGITNGAPLLHGGANYGQWSEIFNREYRQLQSSDPHAPSLIDTYGATNPAEFFAVATETFFEEPVELQRLHPALYNQLASYYCVDPRQWLV